MDEDYGSNFIVITDDDGNEFELEVLDELEIDGQNYLACLSAEAPENDDEEDLEMIILKSVIEDGEEFLSTPDSDEEAEFVYDRFMEKLYGDDEGGEDE